MGLVVGLMSSDGGLLVVLVKMVGELGLELVMELKELVWEMVQGLMWVFVVKLYVEDPKVVCEEYQISQRGSL